MKTTDNHKQNKEHQNRRDVQLQMSLITQSVKENQFSKIETGLQVISQNVEIDQAQGVIDFQSFGTYLSAFIEPLIKFGKTHEIKEENLPKLRDKDTVTERWTTLADNFQKSRARGSSKKGAILMRAISMTYWKDIIKMAFLWVFAIANHTCFPLLISAAILHASSNAEQKNNFTDLLIFVGIFFSTLFRNIADIRNWTNWCRNQQNMRSQLSALLYNKILQYPLLSDKRYAIADIIDLDGQHLDRCSNLMMDLPGLIILPFQLLSIIIMMAKFAGWYCLSGLFFIGVGIFIQRFTSKFGWKIEKKCDKLHKQKIRVIQQAFNIIRFVKINALEEFFINKINKAKENQIVWKYKRLKNSMLVRIVFNLLTPFGIGSIFATYLYFQTILTGNEAFTIISIFYNLNGVLTWIPHRIQHFLQCLLSIKKIEQYLLAQNMNQQCVLKSIKPLDQLVAIQIKQGNFWWNLKKQQEQKKQNKKQNTDEDANADADDDQQQQEKQEEKEKIILFNEPREKVHSLKDIDIKFNKGSFTMIIGKIGAGKSSLLYSILNEMIPDEKAKIAINGSIAFASQKSWIMSTTLKENIVFFKPFDEEKFKQALHYSCLDKDIQSFEKGVETVIGQKGINLSGGQKARVSLARVLYADPDILLLDDIISALDVHVGRFIIRQTLKKYLKGKTILVATHATAFCQEADQIVLMKQGHILANEKYQVLKDTPEFKELLESSQSKKKDQKVQNNNSDSESQSQLMTNSSEIMKNSKTDSKKLNQKSQSEEETDELITELVQSEQEQKKVDTLNWDNFKKYLKFNGGLVFIIPMAIFGCLHLTFQFLGTYVVKNWTESQSLQYKYIYLYAFVVLISCIVQIGQYLYVAKITFTKSIQMGNQMATSLVYASIPNFFDRVPMGKILRRFTNHLTKMDEQLANRCSCLFTHTLNCIKNLILIAYTTNILVICPIIMVLFLVNKVKYQIMKLRRSCFNIQDQVKSPLSSIFSETLDGLPTIRSFELSEKFKQNYLKRLDRSKRITLTKLGLQTKLCLNISFITYLINMVAIGYGLLGNHHMSQASMGILITHSIYLNYMAMGLLFNMVDSSYVLYCMSRIISFASLRPENGYQDRNKQHQKKGQPAFENGKITLENLSIRYRNGLPLVLKAISLNIKPGEHIGVVGRTGAGKSTLFASLLQTIEPAQGVILIDDKPAAQYDLSSYRSSITVIQQEPVLIKGTFKQNLDILGQHSIQEIEKIIQECNIKQLIEKRGGLNSKIDNQSLSIGQKQLIFITRALLKHNKIVLIDEATANIDTKNDQLIQKIIAEKFKDNTVITIAHRLSTVDQSDKILVMQQGKIAEFGTPQQLRNKQNGIYKKMCQSHSEDYLK